MRRWIGVLGVSAVAGGLAWFERMRRRGELPRLVTHRFNPHVMRLGLAGGRRSPWAILEHVGRTSGTTYLTPISVISSPATDIVYIRLSYGHEVHWVRNIVAAGHCRLQHHATILELDGPAIVTAGDNELLSPRVRAALDRAGRNYLRLHVARRTPGSLVDPAPRRISGREVVALAIHRGLDRRLSRFGVWVFRHTRGEIAQPWKVDALVLTTRGRRSGKQRAVVLQYFRDEDGIVLAAANDGGASHPGWYYNLVAEPAASVEIRGERIDVRAEELSADAAAWFWPRLLERAPDYERYQRATSRRIPLLRLLPVETRD